MLDDYHYIKLFRFYSAISEKTDSTSWYSQIK